MYGLIIIEQQALTNGEILQQVLYDDRKYAKDGEYQCHQDGQPLPFVVLSKVLLHVVDDKGAKYDEENHDDHIGEHVDHYQRLGVLLCLIESDYELHDEVDENDGAHGDREQPSIPEESPLELFYLEYPSIEAHSEAEEDHLIEVDDIGGEKAKQEQAIEDSHHEARHLIRAKALAKVQYEDHRVHYLGKEAQLKEDGIVQELPFEDLSEWRLVSDPFWVEIVPYLQREEDKSHCQCDVYAQDQYQDNLVLIPLSIRWIFSILCFHYRCTFHIIFQAPFYQLIHYLCTLSLFCMVLINSITKMI